MKLRKKILASVLTGLLALSAVACSSGGDDAGGAASEPATTTS